MSSEILIALMSLAGTLCGSLFGILRANQVVSFRLETLEKKVDQHNNLVERTAILEQNARAAHRRIDELREELY